MQGIINIFDNQEDAEDDEHDGGKLYYFPKGVEVVGAPHFTGSTDKEIWVVIHHWKD